MEKLKLYYNAVESFDKQDVNNIDEELLNNLYGEGICFSMSKEGVPNYGDVNEYELDTTGLKVKFVKEHGREMFDTITEMVNDKCDYDVVIIPEHNIDVYAELVFEHVIMSTNKEGIDTLCKVVEQGYIDKEDNWWNNERVEFDFSNPHYEVVVRNQETLDKLVLTNKYTI